MALIDIAMPAYNRGAWVDGFMQSLLAQSWTDWRLVARDDRSTDSTVERLSNWQASLDGRMTILPDSSARNLGVVGNYNAVLSACSARWVMTADPDDIWLPGKIEITTRAMCDTESQFGTSTPIAICTDATVVDESLRPAAASYWRLYRMNPRLASRPIRTAVESVALGSTMMVNRALLDTALPIHPGAPYQDWWLALVAATFGKVVALRQTTILYRRHSTNETTGPYLSSLGAALRRTLRDPLAPHRHLEKLISQAASQAHGFAERYRKQLDARSLAAFEALASLPSQGAMKRRLSVIRQGLWFGSAIKNLGLIALL